MKLEQGKVVNCVPCSQESKDSGLDSTSSAPRPEATRAPVVPTKPVYLRASMDWFRVTAKLGIWISPRN